MLACTIVIDLQIVCAFNLTYTYVRSHTWRLWYRVTRWFLDSVLLSLVRQCFEYRNDFVKLNIQNKIKSLFMLFVVISYILIVILLIAPPSPTLMALRLFSWPFPPLVSNSTPMSCCCAPVFRIEQFGGFLRPFVFPSIPRLSSGPTSSENSF